MRPLGAIDERAPVELEIAIKPRIDDRRDTEWALKSGSSKHGNALPTVGGLHL